VIVADSSAWIALLRNLQTRVAEKLLEAFEARDVAVTEVVVAEVLSGTADDIRTRRTRNLLLGCPLLRLRGLRDFEAAAELRRVCMREGETVRSVLDCLVAVPAIAAGVPVLHADHDFDVLARHTPLEVVSFDD
jgi:predicted nucleic acid-binding protein